jgi:hypothetical protein
LRILVSAAVASTWVIALEERKSASSMASSAISLPGSSTISLIRALVSR